jgi:asparagine synthase (glutamine-hydrolysing)
MCGICGQYKFISQAPVDVADIKRMTQTLVHRGPDDEGFFVSGSLGLGFRRLSIIDLKGGHQPMSDLDETVWIVFNGEIYNFLELRKELEKFGHVFRTTCDTEVIIFGYKQWGTRVFEHLNGMFAIGLWDVQERKLVLARDAMGIKPLYYRIDPECVYFGSEIRAIVRGTNERPDIDPLSLNLFLRYRYTPSPLTLFRGIKKLAPGTMLTLEEGKSLLERWYRYEPIPFSPMKSSIQAREDLLEIYKQAVKRHLISDVPVGLLLSGGIDSGLLLGLMSLSHESWPTYSIGYGKTFRDDELVDAAQTARMFFAKHVSIELQRETFEASLPKIISCLEEPIASSSIVPMYFVCERARQDVKVALMGQGPDELFGGYRRHLGIHYGALWRGLPTWLRNQLRRGISVLPRNETLKRGVYALDIQDRMRRYQHTFSIAPGDVVDDLFQDGLLSPGSGDEVLNCWKELSDLMGGTGELGGFQFLEMRSSLPDELLMYADKLSMAHGLEIRVPFLDRQIVEYAEKLNDDLKVRNGKGKWIHRQVCKQFLPGTIINRKKRGFAVNVVDDWFRDSLNKKMVAQLLDNDSAMFKFLRPEGVRRLVDEHRVGTNDNHKILFSLIVFEEWLRSTLDHMS